MSRKKMIFKENLEDNNLKELEKQCLASIEKTKFNLDLLHIKLDMIRTRRVQVEKVDTLPSIGNI